MPPEGYGDTCIPLIVIAVYKNDRDKEGRLLSRDFERLTTIQGEPIGVGAARGGTKWNAEYSKDGQRTTWHPIDACPLEA